MNVVPMKLSKTPIVQYCEWKRQRPGKTSLERFSSRLKFRTGFWSLIATSSNPLLSTRTPNY